ncbi:oxidoreductase [Pelagibacterium lentulum]|uniref:Quinone oxidoreductase n=1 Tax=Pelagibacterium lentulum TaxID=2029865 RepID=A0A916R7J6_9HYPH|nr:oxidoreductase [Pelagibacterium lentulum]GGA40304.1 quinone oxidoreductase [Pelagibacterium lentulum]
MSFRALILEKNDTGEITRVVKTLGNDSLPEGNVTVDIEWSGFNYKDGLCLTGAGGLVRNYPHVAGIDFAGMVSESTDARYKPGDRVVLTGWRVGEAHWGGFSQRARVNADWLVPLDAGLTTRDAMVLGTAGLTAMLSVNRLEQAGVAPESGDILVTGAAGGVGTIALSLLSTLGYSTTALSGRAQHADTLKRLGANTVLARQDFLAEPDKPLERAKWAGAVDTAGGKVLGKLLRQIQYGGAVAALGNAAGIEMEANVLPFILRGVTLMGIDSVMQPFEIRAAAWRRLAGIFDPALYENVVAEIGLEDLEQAASDILNGTIHGRVIVKP